MQSVPVQPVNPKGQGHTFFSYLVEDFIFNYSKEMEVQSINVADYWQNNLQKKMRKGPLNVMGDKYGNIY